MKKAPLSSLAIKHLRDWRGVFAHDEVIAVAILGRLLDHSHVVSLREKSWRLKEMEEAIQFTRELEKEGNKGVNRAVFSSRQDFGHLARQEDAK